MRVIFHGKLKTLCPEIYEVEAASPYEALNALVQQIPALRSAAAKIPCAIVDHEHVELILGKTDVDEIHVVPTFEGSKRGGFFQIVIGALLIAASFIPGIGQATAAFMFNFGLSMALGGVIQLLAPSPTTTTSAGTSNPESSKILGPPRNTVRLGTRIPVAYGLNKLFGHIISFDVNVTQYETKYDQNTGGATSGGGGDTGEVSVTAVRYWRQIGASDSEEWFVDFHVVVNSSQATAIQITQVTNGHIQQILSQPVAQGETKVITVGGSGTYPGVFQYVDPDAAASFVVQLINTQGQTFGYPHTANLGRWNPDE